MIKPPVVEPEDDVTIVGRVFGTPLVVKGGTWFPLTQFVVWGIMSWVAGKSHPDRPWWKRLYTGALTMLAILGSEWGHNLAHAAAAQWVGKPMDALRITWGMPLVVYYDVNDEEVTPREHIIRALGGPVFNAVLLGLAVPLRQLTGQGTIARDVADAAVGMNTFLSTASLVPIPAIDGGPILKWSLVANGCGAEEADEIVKEVNKVVGGGLGIAAGVAAKKRRWLLGSVLALFSALALAVGFGLLKEHE